MTKKNVITLAGALALLLAAVALLKVSSGGDKPLQFCDSKTAGQTSAVEITLPDGTTEKFIKNNTGWDELYPLHYRANARELDGFADSVCALDMSDVLSTSQSALKDFGLDADNAVTVKFLDSKKRLLLEFSAGREAQTAQAVFTKIAPTGEVREATGLSRSLLARPFMEWLDKTIYASPPDKITAFAWQHGKDTWKARRKYAGWIWESKGIASTVPPEAAKSKLTALATLLSDFQAERVLPLEGQYADPAPFKEDFALTVYAEGTQPVTLRIGTADNFIRIIKNGESRVIFITQKWKGSALLVKPQELR